METADPVRTLADRLVELCGEGKNLEALESLYSEGIVSVEAMACEGDPSGMPRQMEGIEAVRGKTRWWLDNHEVHSAEVRGPFLHAPDRFAVFFSFDVTYKPQGQRCQMEEVGIYTVADGKVVKEEFFYNMPG